MLLASANGGRIQPTEPQLVSRTTPSLRSPMPPDDRVDIPRVMATALHVLTEELGAWLPVMPDVAAVGAESPAMRRVMAIAARIARSDSTVLITGETGVGKERLARWLHRASPRAVHPFVAVNCGAVAETLLDSELFGHVRGAFTGAQHDRRGLFEEADRGTLFLDEVGDVPGPMQVKLLRVLEERDIRRVGDSKTRPIDVRIMSATHRDLRHEVIAHRFREDLFYRLTVIDLHIPPLRERPEDLRTLAQVFLARTATKLRRPSLSYAPPVWERFLTYAWPGNIRELAHAIERACAVAAGPQIELEDLPAAVRFAPVSPALPSETPLRRLTREHVDAVLARYQGHRGAAAKALGISRSTLYRILRRGR
jgi:transcriptional regulator with PAS, ATPase and Fis domain